MEIWARHNAIPPPMLGITACRARERVPLCCLTVYTKLDILP
jgi:hypothetical protein